MPRTKRKQAGPGWTWADKPGARGAFEEGLRSMLDGDCEVDAVMKDLDTYCEARCRELMAALEDVLASASPHPTEHPRMAVAWSNARAALAKARNGAGR